MPHEDFEGLRVLSDMARRASKASGGGASGGGEVQVNIHVTNQAGGEVEASSTTRRNQNGGVDIDIMLRRKVSGEIANGDHDRAMAARFGATPMTVPR